MCSMEAEGIVIRIKTPMGDMDSSVDCPSHLNFNDLLAAIRDVMPEATITAFEYEDEVGDRITVRSDEELKAMLSYVNTRPESSSGRGSSAADSLSNDSSLKKSSAELKKILTNGQINEHDLQYQEQLGHGNGGTVYNLGLLEQRYQHLARAVIPLDITVELQKQIMSELEILYKCDSPYIIKFYSAFFVENRISICTEFMDDVKPSNMLVNTRGQVKLCDFGVSTQLVNSIAKTYVGTNAYMAPERISGEQYGIHSDVWSVGISFMEDPPMLPLGQFSEKFVNFITQCMRKQPKERPAPNNLMDHPFIMQYDDGNTEVVSMWVSRSLEDRRAQQGQRLM
ncbi:Dual specificity mitogen-activated protein kinase kinase 5 [Triplophysa tibetana]|uniref:mitogen-activated protein kinase kinase n=1 Tax=Triplophysa tibetana TaxID=1572043 RepID=A0A5A9PMI1_9TELE|nr:Dual specificity mitogen-activated protein kinase kinase 5 [Triplophysa tibetana]